MAVSIDASTHQCLWIRAQYYEWNPYFSRLVTVSRRNTLAMLTAQQTECGMGGETGWGSILLCYT